jgi:hypothetical protein
MLFKFEAQTVGIRAGKDYAVRIPDLVALTYNDVAECVDLSGIHCLLSEIIKYWDGKG